MIHTSLSSGHIRSIARKEIYNTYTNQEIWNVPSIEFIHKTLSTAVYLIHVTLSQEPRVFSQSILSVLHSLQLHDMTESTSIPSTETLAIS